MSIEAQELAYLGLFEETTYQADESGTPASFVDFPYFIGTLDAQGAQVALDPMTGKMRLDAMDKKVLGPKSCSVSFASALHSHGQDLDGDVTPVTKTTWGLLRALQTIMGGMAATTNESAQTTVQAGTTTTAVVCNDATHAARFQAGTAIGCEVVSGSGLIEVREVASVASDTVTVKQAFSGTPVTSSAVRGGITVYMTEDPSTSLQVLLESREATDGAWYGGLQGGFSLQLPVGGLGQIAFALQGADWGRVGSSGATIPSYSNFSPMALAPLEVTVPTVGATTRVLVEQSAVEITPGIVYAPQTSGAATNTIARMRRMPTRPLVQGTFTAPYEDDTWYTAHSSRTDLALFAQAGNVPGSTCLISVPTIQIVEPPQRGPSAEGIVGQTVTWQGRLDGEIGSTSELSYSALRMHFL
jgi:hypothetical protein